MPHKAGWLPGKRVGGCVFEAADCGGLQPEWAQTKSALQVHACCFALCTVAVLGGLHLLSWLLRGSSFCPCRRSKSRCASWVECLTHACTSHSLGCEAPWPAAGCSGSIWCSGPFRVPCSTFLPGCCVSDSCSWGTGCGISYTAAHQHQQRAAQLKQQGATAPWQPSLAG